MEYINYIFAQAEVAEITETATGSSSQQWIILLLIFAGMWFLLIAPQRKREKQRRQMLSEIKTDDDVVTIGGIYGTVTNIKESTYIIKIADNVKIEILKSAVSDNLSRKAEAKKN